MRLTQGNTYFAVDEDGYPFIVKIIKNTKYNGYPAVHWNLYFRRHPRSFEISPNGRREEYISNNWSEKSQIKIIGEWEIPYYMIYAIFTYVNNDVRVDFK